MTERGMKMKAPLQLIQIDDQGSLVVLADVLRDIIEQNDAEDNPVVLISVVGAQRTGKSFLLNWLLRYLLRDRDATAVDWVTATAGLEGGFDSRSGTERVTEGVLVYPEAFKVKLPDSDQMVSVLLLDTQGCFDGRTSSTTTSLLFAIVALLSDRIIYNIPTRLQETDL